MMLKYIYLLVLYSHLGITFNDVHSRVKNKHSLITYEAFQVKRTSEKKVGIGICSYSGQHIHVTFVCSSIPELWAPEETTK